jgi:hypothetical protein
MASISVDPDAGWERNEARRLPPAGRRRHTIATAVLALTSLVGPVLLIALTDDGIHATPDSLTYVGAADQLANGHGWTYPFGEVGSPVTLFPPLYPLLLAVPVAMGVDAFDWVRWQNALLFTLFAASVGWVVYRETQWRVVPAVLASLLVQLGIPTVHTYARIWSETVFFPLVVLTLVALARHVVTGRLASLVLAAVLSAVAMLTRYAGLSLFVSVCALLAVWPARPVRDRVRSMAVYAAIAALPNAVWVLRNLSVSGTLTGDAGLIHGLTGSATVDGLLVILRWLFPDRPEGIAHDVLVAIAVLASFALGVVVVVRLVVGGGRVGDLALPALVPVCLVYAVVHFTFIAVANAFSTRAPPFNNRILGPSFAPLVIAVVVAGGALWRGSRGRIASRLAAGAVGASLLALSILAATTTVPKIFGDRVGSADEYRAFDRTLTSLAFPRTRLYSTRPFIAWYLLRQPVSSLPRSCRGGLVLPNPSFRQELADLDDRLAEEPRAVIVFRRSKGCEPFSIEILKRELRLERVGPTGAPGAVWVLVGPTALT